MIQAEFAFDGKTYDPQYDGPRLSSQFGRVKALMADGGWRTLREISMAVGGSETSISARLRDVRKIKFGAHKVERRPRSERERGLWEYRVIESL